MQLGKIEKALEDHNIALVRCIYAGPDGITRGKAVPRRYFRDAVESGIGLTQAQASVTVFDALPPHSAFQPVGEVRICPDLATFQLLPYLPGHARLLSDLETLDGEPWELCPRSLLKSVLADVESRGWSVEAVFENEFTIYTADEDGVWRPIDALNCFSSAAMDIASEYVLPIIDALEQQGIFVEKYFPEAGGGQQEIPVRHQSGLAAADQQVVFRETVRGVAHDLGFRVSFMPKPDPNAAGNGCHVHLSLWKDGTNIFYDASREHSLSQTARHFIGGILAHLPSLLALTAPTTNSYKRFVERCWSSCYTSWGPDNREASVRVPSCYRGREEATLNLEYKPADPTCNPYLALSGILCAGMHGIDQKVDPGSPVLTDPALLSAAERAKRNLLPYPSSLGDAVSALEQNSVLSRQLGDRRVRDYVTMKRAEISAIESLPEETAEELAYKFRF